MLHIFRKIRRKASDLGKTTRYLRYALGEILLIVIGIVIALQLQNWNEKHKQEALFTSNLEQIYNSLKNEIEIFDARMAVLDRQISTLDYIFKIQDSVKLSSINKSDKQRLIEGLFWVTAPAPEPTFESKYFASNLSYDPESITQRELTKQISYYAENLDLSEPLVDDTSFYMLKEYGLAFPELRSELYYSDYQNDSTYYSDEDYKKLNRLLASDAFLPSLKSLKSGYFAQRMSHNTWKSDAASLMKMIKNYFPEVKLLYQDVGIIGTSLDGFDDVGGESYSMIETDFELSIWETELYLKEGLVKFRCRNSWSQNWGGQDFPKGTAVSDGDNIQITKAGNYRIILNLLENTYEFIALEE